MKRSVPQTVRLSLSDDSSLLRDISEQDNAEELLQEFEKELRLSKIQASPYHAVLTWFKNNFKDYKSYNAIKVKEVA